MNEETIVAMYDTAAQADAAVRDLQAADVPASAIQREPAAGTVSTTATAPMAREPGFWSTLFGGESSYDTAVYDRSVQSGSHVVTVRAPAEHVAIVHEVLERHNPVDVDERGASYGIDRESIAGHDSMGMGGALPAAGLATTGTAGARTADTGTGLRGDEERLQLAEEELQVGKRLVNRGTTRIRRFVIETPVEENVSLHSERVTVERRPVAAGGAALADPDFTERTIEVTESDEEAVVSKVARVKEELVIRKEVADRTETVRDTVRREDVEIARDGDVRTQRTGSETLAPVRP